MYILSKVFICIFLQDYGAVGQTPQPVSHDSASAPVEEARVRNQVVPPSLIPEVSSTNYDATNNEAAANNQQ